MVTLGLVWVLVMGLLGALALSPDQQGEWTER
jgi:hypothetical protein